MKVSDLPSALNLEILQGTYTDRDLTGAYTSDLLSDVMAHAEDVEVLITIQSHKNTIAVATLAGVAAIIVCNERPVPPDMITAAADEDIGIFRSTRDQFTISGEIYALIHRG